MFASETLDDGIDFLREECRIHCTGAERKSCEAYAGIMVLVYPVGTPLLYAVLSFQLRDVVADSGADKRSSQSIAGPPGAVQARAGLLRSCRVRTPYIADGCSGGLSSPNDAAQSAITMLVALFFFAVFEVLGPYTVRVPDMWLSRGGHVIVS